MKANYGRVLVKVDMEYKNHHTFSDGTEIRIERGYNNLNFREVNPVNATIVDGSQLDIPEGAEVLIHHNSTHDVNRLFDYTSLSGEAEASSVKLFSIPLEECYLWRLNEGEWQPVKNFVIVERIYKPYSGIVQGIEPELVKNRLFAKSGNLANKAVIVLKASDYEIVCRDKNGQEQRIIRCRHYEDDDTHIKQEIVAIDDALTEKILNGEYLIGLNPLTAKKHIPYESLNGNEIGRRPNSNSQSLLS